MGRYKSQQQGAALITALVIVMIVSILGAAIGKQVLSARRNSTLFLDHASSFVRAESALNEAQAVITENHPAISTRLDPTDNNTLVTPAFASATWWQSDGNWGAAVELENSSSSPLTGEPEYLIEDAGKEPALDMGVSLPRRRFLRIYAKAQGNGSAETILQAHVAVME